MSTAGNHRRRRSGVYAYRKGAKEVTLPCKPTDLGVRVYDGCMYPPYNSIYSWANHLGGYWREPTADDVSIPNIEKLALKAERLGKPVDIATGQVVDVGQEIAERASTGLDVDGFTGMEVPMRDEKTVWGIHAGPGGEADDIFLKKNVMAMGWSEVPNIAALPHPK